MGSGTWSTDDYVSTASFRRARGIDDFDYDTKVKSGEAKGIHPDLDPMNMTVREARDSDEHPESLPIAVLFDVTGSMRRVPRVLQTKLASIMDVIITKAGIAHPQILVGAIGDSTCDEYPFQVGQFESDNRFDDQLREIILEGGGGGQNMESYGLAYYWAAYKTATDSFEKRGKRGYLFTIGDEIFWPIVTAQDVLKVFGGQPDHDEGVHSLFEKASEQWDIYHLFAMEGSYANRRDMHGVWQELLGERFIKVEDASLIAEVIAGLIHMMESAYDVTHVLDDVGLSGEKRKVVENALVPLAGAVTPTKGSGSLPKSHTAE